jgi:hypothetical protein
MRAVSAFVGLFVGTTVQYDDQFCANVSNAQGTTGIYAHPTGLFLAMSGTEVVDLRPNLGSTTILPEGRGQNPDILLTAA